jgi:S-adenosylmethionine hydrolase
VVCGHDGLSLRYRPGVGGTRPAFIVEADGRWYFGPGNGLFELVERRAASTRAWDIDWKPERLSASEGSWMHALGP